MDFLSPTMVSDIPNVLLLITVEFHGAAYHGEIALTHAPQIQVKQVIIWLDLPRTYVFLTK